MFRLVTKAVKESVNETTKAIELKRQETTKWMREMKDTTKSIADLFKKADLFDFHLLPALYEIFNSNN